MELNREQIIKALEYCKTTTPEDCIECPYRNKGNSLYVGCVNTLVKDTLSLIKELSEEVESLKQAMEHEHASFMEIFGQYGEKCDRLTEENESLSQSLANTESILANCTADTVRKMHSMLCEGRVSNDTVVIVANQIAKEMLEGSNET